MASLSGVRGLVTGGTSGLGRAMAEALVRAGARVVLTGRDRERAEATAAELGPGASGLGLDVLDATSVAAAGVHDERIVARDFDDWLAARAGTGE